MPILAGVSGLLDSPNASMAEGNRCLAFVSLIKTS
jgi:hypothetical protein